MTAEDEAPVIRRYMGNRGGLAQTREDWARLAGAAEAAERQKLPYADELAAEAEAMRTAAFTIDVECMFCHEPKPVTVMVGDPGRAVPGDTMLCGDCDARISGKTGVPGGIAIVFVN